MMLEHQHLTTHKSKLNLNGLIVKLYFKTDRVCDYKELIKGVNYETRIIQFFG